MKLKKYEIKENKYDLQNDGTAIYDVAYSSKSKNNKLDLYLPRIKKDKYPLVIFVHGGAFFKSDKSRHLSNLLNSLLYGYACASVNYRFNDETDYNGIKSDVIDAFNYLSKLESIDESKIICWGESHGALLCDDIAINHKQDLLFRLLGVISFYAPIDLYDHHLYKEEKNEHIFVNGIENDSRTFKKVGHELLEELKKVNILENIQHDNTHYFLLHGLSDEFIPVRYTQEFDQALTIKHIQHEAHYIKDGIHGIDFYADSKYNRKVMNFIEKIVEGENENAK